MREWGSAVLQTELASLAVFGETTVGWDERTPPNETVDHDGKPFPEDRGFGVPDPRAPARRSPDDPGVRALRDHLRANNGLRGLPICDPWETRRAAQIFQRDGFVVVRDLLSPDQLARLREASARVLRRILEVRGEGGRKYVTESFRLPHRYSYGTCSATRQMLHDRAWAEVIDLPTTTPLLETIFGSRGYRVTGAGGDLCLPGAIEYQHLHGDVVETHQLPPDRLRQSKALGIHVEPDADPAALSLYKQRRIVDLTPAVVTINFLMSDLTWENGPIRQIPGTHAVAERPPSPTDEPEWMRLSTLVGATAGSGVFRDNRAWHGATPNLSREIRALPNIEYLARWVPAESIKRTMPHEIWETLSAHAQQICQSVKADSGVRPKGAGAMSPLTNQRRAAAGKSEAPKDLPRGPG